MRLNSIRFPRTLIMAISMIAIMFTFTTPSSAQTNMTVSLALEVSSDQGVTMPQLTLVQDGMKLTGDYSSDALGQAKIMGTVDGRTITISFEADLGGQLAPVTYTGTINDEGVWSGTLDIAGGLLQGTFSAKKK